MPGEIAFWLDHQSTSPRFTCKGPFIFWSAIAKYFPFSPRPGCLCPLNTASGNCQYSAHFYLPLNTPHTRLPLAATPWWIETYCCFSDLGNISIEMSERHETGSHYPRSDDWHHLYSINIEEGKVIPNLMALLQLIRIQYSITGLLMNVSI